MRQIKQKQSILQEAGFYFGKIDGVWGPKSRKAEAEYNARRGDSILFTNGSVKPQYLIPHYSTRQMQATFGSVGKNQTYLHLPYPMRLAWDKSIVISRFSCHREVLPDFARAHDQILDHYGDKRIRELDLDLFGGCLNVRKMRGGDDWSSHAWGTSEDTDPSHNRMRQRPSTTNMARPANKAFCDIMVENGFGTLEYDLMHWQRRL